LAAPKKRSRKKTIDKSPTFAGPTLLKGEDARALRKLSEHINRAVKPADALEEIWVADVVHLQWELQRLHECKAQLIRAKMDEGFSELLASICGPVQADMLLRNRRLGLDNAEVEIQKMFTARDLSTTSINAQTIALYIDDLERLDRMIASAEARRNNALREVHFHREVLARNLRRVCQEPVDAEFTEIAPSASSNDRPRIAAHKRREPHLGSEVAHQGDDEGALAEKAEDDEEE